MISLKFITGFNWNIILLYGTRSNITNRIEWLQIILFHARCFFLKITWVVMITEIDGLITKHNLLILGNLALIFQCLFSAKQTKYNTCKSNSASWCKKLKQVYTWREGSQKCLPQTCIDLANAMSLFSLSRILLETRYKLRRQPTGTTTNTLPHLKSCNINHVDVPAWLCRLRIAPSRTSPISTIYTVMITPSCGMPFISIQHGVISFKQD